MTVRCLVDFRERGLSERKEWGREEARLGGGIPGQAGTAVYSPHRGLNGDGAGLWGDRIEVRAQGVWGFFGAKGEADGKGDGGGD